MSLRARLLTVLVSLAAVGLIVAGIATYASLRSFLVERVDRTVTGNARARGCEEAHQLRASTDEPRRQDQQQGAHCQVPDEVRFDRNDYSVPTAYAHHDVTAVGGIDEVAIAVGPTVVARHRRC